MRTRRNRRYRPLVILGLLAVALFAVAPVAWGRWDGGNTVAQDGAPANGEDPAPTSGPPDTSAGAEQPPPSLAPPAPRDRAVALTPLGQASLGAQGYHGDVWGYKGYAYVGTWGSAAACPATGVKIVDLSDPAEPRQVATAAAFAGTSQEDVVVRGVSTAAFTGDLLVAGIQSCGIGPGGRPGMAVYDVTDPRRPVELSFFDVNSRGVHELDLVQQGDRVLALLAVPRSEAAAGSTGDFRIVDLTDPRRPVQLSHWGAGAGLGLDINSGTGCRPSIYAHSARAGADGRRAYLSYWDAGVIVLDISDPSAPRLAGRLPVLPGEEGETHSVAESADGRYLLVADEDTVYSPPYGLRLRVQTPTGPLDVRACQSLFSQPLDAAGLIEAELVSGGTACPNAPAAADPSGRVVLVDSGGCSLAEKAARLAREGARAVITSVPGEPVSVSGGARVAIPVIVVSQNDAAALRQTAGGAVTLPSERRWSGMRVWDITDLGAPRQIATYQTPNSVRFPAPEPNGFYTIHNAQVVGDLAFASWYTDGVRAIDITDPGAPRELAAYVPLSARNPQRAAFPDTTLVWGVYPLGDLLLVSDINSGLHVIRVDITTP